MGRHRTPSNLLELRGAYIAHPERKRARAAEPVVSEPLGDPPRHLSRLERAAWREIVRITPFGILAVSDRVAVEITAVLLAEMRSNPCGFSAAKLSRLESFLARFGMTPSDRSRIHVPAPQKDNPFDEFRR